MIPVYATRADGWPLCPMCHEDELWSPFAWDGSDPKPPMQAWIDAGLRCYRCGWDSSAIVPTTAASKELESFHSESYARLQVMLIDHQTGKETDITEFMLPWECAVMVPPYLAPPACPLCGYALTRCQCGTTPARDDIQAMPKPSRFVKRGAYMLCLNCNFTSTYCRCSELMIGQAPDDGPAAASLAQRIKDCKGGR